MKKTIYPLYVVIDNSNSMNKEIDGVKRINLAREIPLSLLRLYEEDNALISSVYVSLILFNTEAECILELGEISQIRDMPEQLEARSRTSFSAAFDELYLRIGKDAQRLSPIAKFMKPAVLFVTDGLPNDPKETRAESYRRLVPLRKFDNKPDTTANPLSPQMLMWGIDASFPEVLEMYATSPADVFKARSEDVDKQIMEIAQRISATVSHSMSNPVIDETLPWLGVYDDDDADF